MAPSELNPLQNKLIIQDRRPLHYSSSEWFQLSQNKAQQLFEVDKVTLNSTFIIDDISTVVREVIVPCAKAYPLTTEVHIRNMSVWYDQSLASK